MPREIEIDEVEKTLYEENIDETIVVKRKNKSDVIIMNINEYKKIFEKNLIEKLKKAEEQIKNGEVKDADLVLAEMMEKYEYQ